MRFTSFIGLISIALRFVQKQAILLKLKCEREAEPLNNTIYYEDFKAECMESGHWYVTELETNRFWFECVALNNYTVYDQCMVDNFIERSRMTPTNNCYFDQIGALKADRKIDTYRLVAIDERYLNKSKASLYTKYRNCIDFNWEPYTDKEAIDLYKCFCIGVKFYDRITEKINATKVDMECKSQCTSEAYENLQNNRVDGNNMAYIKCLMEKLYIMENNCYYVERDIEFVGDRRTALEKEGLRNCFRNSVGKFEVNFMKLFKCSFQLKFYIQ